MNNLFRRVPTDAHMVWMACDPKSMENGPDQAMSYTS